MTHHESQQITQMLPATGVEQHILTHQMKASQKPVHEQFKHTIASYTGSQSSSRKGSYASVKEDSTTTQSFRSRRLLSKGHPVQETPENDWNISSRPQRWTIEASQELSSDDECAIEIDTDTASVHYGGPITLESMPDEILDAIFSYVTLEADKDRYADPKVDLFNLIFVSKSVHAAALRVLYRHVKIPQSKAFAKFNNALAEDAQLRDLVQCLDFSNFSSIGFGRAKSVTLGRPYLTPATLKACLDRLTNLKAFLVHEHLDDELDVAVLLRLFNMPTLQAIDFCASASKAFTTAFNDVCMQLPDKLANIQRLSLHECTTLRPQIFETLMPRLARVTHLDVAHTMINDKALLSIPKTARLTHLNLERCNQVTGPAVVEFLTQHPAAQTTMVYLNLMADASRYRLLSEDDLSSLLPSLPSTLRSLNLGGARINASHVCALRALATHLEELGLKGANLSLAQDVSHVLSLISGNCDEEVQNPDWRHNLRYLDLTDVRSVTQMSLTYSPASITTAHTAPLEVIEVSSSVLNDISKRIKNVKSPEWTTRELGRRGWYVRQPLQTQQPDDKSSDGYRTWKMGARWWGMRKIPIFEQDTSGMYGYYMFKRA